MKYIKYYILIIIIQGTAIIYSQNGDSTAEIPNIGIEEKLGDIIPEDVTLMDEYGQPVNLKSLITKPILLSLVYYRCSGICTPTLNGIADVVDNLDLQAGKDFDIITVSFDPLDKSENALDKRENYIDKLEKKIPNESWRFLTGDSINIKKLTNAVGWKYIKQGDEFAHASGVMVISPQGKIVRYLFGIIFLPMDVKLAIAEAEEGKIGPSINKLLKFCYSYDPEGRTYTFNILRVVGSGMLLSLGVMFLVLILKKKRPADEHPRKEI